MKGDDLSAETAFPGMHKCKQETQTVVGRNNLDTYMTERASLWMMLEPGLGEQLVWIMT